MRSTVASQCEILARAPSLTLTQKSQEALFNEISSADHQIQSLNSWEYEQEWRACIPAQEQIYRGLAHPIGVCLEPRCSNSDISCTGITTNPGLGSTTAAKLLAYIGDVRRFSSAKALSAFIGVTPRQRESGSSVHGRSPIGRLGHARVRQALFMPAMVALKHNPAIRIFGERLRANGLAKKAVIAASMHKLVHEIYGVLRSGLAFDPARAASRLELQVSI